MSENISFAIPIPSYAIRHIEKMEILTAYGIHNQKISLFVSLEKYLEVLQKLDDLQNQLETTVSKTFEPKTEPCSQ